jgi:para-nitrobenzyl esterase
MDGRVVSDQVVSDVATMTGWTADEGSSDSSYGTRSAEQRLREREDRLMSLLAWGKQRAASSKTALYTYYWEHPMPGPQRDLYGAFHSSELPYVFDSLRLAQRPWEPMDREIAEKMSSYWANFVRTGDPNGDGLEKWPAFDAGSAVTMELGDRFGVRPVGR